MTPDPKHDPLKPNFVNTKEDFIYPGMLNIPMSYDMNDRRLLVVTCPMGDEKYTTPIGRLQPHTHPIGREVIWSALEVVDWIRTNPGDYRVAIYDIRAFPLRLLSTTIIYHNNGEDT